MSGPTVTLIGSRSAGMSQAASGRVFVGSVAYSNDVEHAEVSRSKRTRWLTFVNERGSVVMAPGVRTHQLSLLFGMGKDWYGRAMAFPEMNGAERTYGSVAVNVVGLEVKGLDSLNYGEL